jgi:hypothetical protein
MRELKLFPHHHAAYIEEPPLLSHPHTTQEQPSLDSHDDAVCNQHKLLLSTNVPHTQHIVFAQSSVDGSTEGRLRHFLRPYMPAQRDYLFDRKVHFRR